MKPSNSSEKEIKSDRLLDSKSQAAGGRIRSLILSLYLPSLIQALCHGVLLPVLPIFALELGASYGGVGLILAGEGFGTLLGALPAGKAVGRFRRKVTMG